VWAFTAERRHIDDRVGLKRGTFEREPRFAWRNRIRKMVHQAISIPIGAPGGVPFLIHMGAELTNAAVSLTWGGQRFRKSIPILIRAVWMG
jgi:hypothetical protein